MSNRIRPKLPGNFPGQVVKTNPAWMFSTPHTSVWPNCFAPACAEKPIETDRPAFAPREWHELNMIKSHVHSRKHWASSVRPHNFMRLLLNTVTVNDLQIASIAWGFTLGFGFLTVWKASKQTLSVYRRYGLWKLNSPYIWMIWLEILVCVVFSIMCWLHLNAVIPPSFAFYFVILTMWALQVQFLLQIIINRVSILLTNRRKAMRLKIGVAVLITAINISVYCIWIPARLQISSRFEHINNVWDRCEKGIYLIVDAALNWYFIKIVRQELVNQGLIKYDRLVRFNMWIIFFSLSMDVLIIGMMSLKNSFVYMQFHPLAYIVKLNIEMSMADLIATVSKTAHTTHQSSQNLSHSLNHTHTQPPAPPPSKIKPLTTVSSSSKLHRKKSQASSHASSSIELTDIGFEVNMKREIHTHVENTQPLRLKDTFGGGGAASSNVDGTGNLDVGLQSHLSLEDRDRRKGVEREEKGMGVSTKVFV